jgi:hypothetical protein
METINTDTWNHLLQVLETIRNTPVKPNEKVFEADSLSSINPLARQRLGDETYEKLRSIWNEASNALSYAKNNNLEESGKRFALAKARHDELEGEARELAEILYYPKVAYYYYKIRDFKAADEAIAKTLEMDDIMQDVYFTFHGHKLHVLQNNSRTLAYRREFEEAAKLVLSVLRYPISPQAKPLYKGKWGQKYLNNYKTIQRLPVTFEFFFFDFSMDSFRFPAFETAVIQNSKGIFNSLKKVSLTDPIYQMAHDWFDAKRSLYIRGNIEEYVQKSTTFLNNYPARYDMFKLLLLWDMLRLTKLTNDSIKQVRLDSFLYEHYKVKLVA